MHPGKVDQSVSLLIAIPDPVLLIVRSIRNLVVIPANRRNEAKLVLRGPVVDQRTETTEAVAAVMNDGGRRGRQPKITAIPFKPT
jgi:hypothetical protein